jgi:hypothetical protein
VKMIAELEVNIIVGKNVALGTVNKTVKDRH